MRVPRTREDVLARFASSSIRLGSSSRGKIHARRCLAENMKLLSFGVTYGFASLAVNEGIARVCARVYMYGGENSVTWLQRVITSSRAGKEVS